MGVGVGKYVIRRLLQMIPVIIGVTFIIYVVVYALGDPTVGRCGERACPAGYIAKFRADYNLDKPLIVQYLLYMGNLVQGDLGTNFFGNLVTVSTLFLISIPIFVIGSTAQLVFGVRLGWFPVTATQGTFYQLIMPAFVLASASLAYIARLMRANLSENLRADYVRTAKAKGLTNTRTVGVHTLRNSLIPVITYIGIDVGVLMGGAVVTERIFNINGIGNFLYRSIRLKDGTSIVGTITFLVLIYLFVNLLPDILYAFLH